MYKIVYTKQVLKDIPKLKSANLEKKALALIDIIKKIQLSTNKTFFYVTHDVSEAVMLGDYLYILSNDKECTNLIFQSKIDSNELNDNLQSKLVNILINN